MDTIPAAISGGGVTGAIIIVCWLLYKCCERRSSRCHSGCMEVSVSDGVPTNTATITPTPNPSPVLKPTAVTVEPAPISV